MKRAIIIAILACGLTASAQEWRFRITDPTGGVQTVTFTNKIGVAWLTERAKSTGETEQSKGMVKWLKAIVRDAIAQLKAREIMARKMQEQQDEMNVLTGQVVEP